MDSGRRQIMTGLVGLAASTLINKKASSNHPASFTANLAAYHSDEFVDAIGVNTHLNWRETIWGRSQEWRQALVNLGIRNQRTSLGALADAKVDFLWLWENSGIKGLILCSRIVQAGGFGPVFNNAETDHYINFLRDQIGFEKLIGIEGANEPNNPKVATFGWERRTRDHQVWLHNKVTHISGGTMPVVSPSVFRRIPADYQALGPLAHCSDIANLHNYTAGRMPKLAVEGPDGATVETTLDGVAARACAATPEKPLWVTEYGHDCSSNPAELKPWVMSEAASARYLLRGLALKFKKGARRIFVYSLLDDAGSGDRYGLLANTATYDLIPRASYYALQRLITRLSDQGENYIPGSLTYTLTGDQANVETLLFRKRDGTWALLIWQEVSLWDRKNIRDITPTPRPLTLSLPFTASVTAFEPSERDAGVVLSQAMRSVSLSVPGHIMLLEIKATA